MSEKSLNNVLRDFIYVDKERLYSLYSQLFQGVAEFSIESFSSSKENDKKEHKIEQKLIEASYKAKNVFLFDHIYNLLEDKLTPQLVCVDESITLANLKPSSYIKVIGKATIEDFEHLIFLLKNFNEIGMALATMQIMNSNKANSQNVKNNSKNSIEQYAKVNGLSLDKKFTESMVKIIENFHGSDLDITIEPYSNKLDVFFKSTLDEKNMRLSSNMVRKTYGNKPIMDWTVVGEITSHQIGKDLAYSTYSNTFSDMFSRIAEIDNSFESANDGQNRIIRVAPIAVYIEHNNQRTSD